MRYSKRVDKRRKRGRRRSFKRLKAYSFTHDCTNSPRRLHGQEVFEGILRDALRQSKFDLGLPMPDFLNTPFENGMQVPYEVKDDPVHGRGIYATQEIPPDLRIWNGDLATFSSDFELVAFLRYLPHELQCDVILWAYPKKNSDRTVLLAMDEGSYMNDGGAKHANCGGEHMTSKRYIEAGEELLEDYSTYIDFEGKVEWFHGFRQAAFGNGEYTDQGAPGQDVDYASSAGAAIDYMFSRLELLAESQNGSQMPLNACMGLLLCLAAFLIKNHLSGRNKMHGL